MKKFILKVILFGFIAFFVLNLWGYLILHSGELTDQLSWYFVLRAENKSRGKIPGKVLVLGDSVCKQFFPLDIPYSLATNASVMAVGHYILAANALAANADNQLQYIVLFSVPQAIGLCFERNQTYSNFMKPFYNPWNLKYISPSLQKKINKKMLAKFAIFPFVKTAPCFSDVNYEEISRQYRKRALSDITVEYLKKLNDLCVQNHIKLILVSPPIKEKLKKISRDWERIRRQIRKEKLEHIFAGYLESVIYLEENCFKDNVHMDLNYVRQNRRKILEKILPAEVLEALEQK